MSTQFYTTNLGRVARPEFIGFGQPPSHYPYPFLDPNRVSAAEIAGSAAVIALALIALGLAYIHGERWLERRGALEPGEGIPPPGCTSSLT